MQSATSFKSEMENDGDGSGIEDSFLPDSGPFLIQEEADDSLGGGGDSDGGGDSGRDGEGFPPLREQDRFLPIANVARIMKKAIPKSGKIAKDARECVQECVSEFISFITSEASDRCRQEKRKTINGEDILYAISTLGFDSYVDPLKLYLQKYRDTMKGERLAGGVTGSGSEMPLEEINDEAFGATSTLTSDVITSDQSQTQNVIYATAYPTQVSVDDLSGGLETVKIAVDLRDGEDQLPDEFRYVTTSVPGSASNMQDFEEQFTGCDCSEQSCSAKTDVSTSSFATDHCSCVCIAERSRGFNYDDEGRLLLPDDGDGPGGWKTNRSAEKPIFECNRQCPCPTEGPGKCSNRVVQRGIQIDGLVVFLTNDGRGWGLRTSTAIVKGTFVCEYAGEIVVRSQAKALIESRDPGDHNYVYVLREHVAGGRVICTYVDPTRLGNVGRFANHSCEPNLTVVSVRVDTAVPRLALFARRHIPAGEELCFDYSGSAEVDSRCELTAGRKLCHCGASKCRKYLPYDDTLFTAS